MTSTTQSGPTVQVYRVYIKATPEAIWEAITQPGWTEQYLYGSRARYDLRPGGAYQAHGLACQGDEAGVADEAAEVVVDGEVIEVDPPRKLVQTWRALWTGEGFTRLTWELKEIEGGVTALTVTHDVAGAPGTAAQVGGLLEDTGAGGGWAEVLSSLKTLVETGKPLRS
ncbi:SRPBCC domain-containing protein [Micromonospora sonneratiae]|uniref:SRPBCC domain-containing protein n=1 Tax=Micromonospora sonneratiae TaxID=1184706 RepID=A0ABW3Y7S2_9ACTN